MYKFRIRLNLINIIFININYIVIQSHPPSLDWPAVDSILVPCLLSLCVHSRRQFGVAISRVAASRGIMGLLYLELVR